MGRYRVQEYRCIMPKVSRYHDTSLLFKALELIPEKSFIWLFSYHFQERCHFKIFYVSHAAFNSRYTVIPQYIDASIPNLQYRYALRYIDASSVVPSLIHTYTYYIPYS